MKPIRISTTPINVCSLMALLLILGAFALPVSAADPAVVVTDYTVTPSVLAPGGYGMIQVTLTNTAGTAQLQESSGISSGGEFQVTERTDISAEIESVQLLGKEIKVIDGNFRQFGASDQGSRSMSPSPYRLRKPKASTSPRSG